jgi:transcriptional regulator with XRE-family HTH domain
MLQEKITPEEIAEWLKLNKKRPAWLAQTMKVTPATVSRWLNNKNPIAGSDEKLLKLLIRDEMPFEIIGEKLLNSVLDFTEDQYRVICVLASRYGITPAQWIANQIRSYLAFNDEAKAETSKIVAERMARNASFLHALPDSKVAEEPNIGAK